MSITSDRFDELGHDFERDRPVVRGRWARPTHALFPVADAVAYAERWLAMHRPREEDVRSPRHPGERSSGGRCPRPATHRVPRLWTHAK